MVAIRIAPNVSLRISPDSCSLCRGTQSARHRLPHIASTQRPGRSRTGTSSVDQKRGTGTPSVARRLISRRLHAQRVASNRIAIITVVGSRHAFRRSIIKPLHRRTTPMYLLLTLRRLMQIGYRSSHLLPCTHHLTYTCLLSAYSCLSAKHLCNTLLRTSRIRRGRTRPSLPLANAKRCCL
jgi:hypothetical protein